MLGSDTINGNVVFSLASLTLYWTNVDVQEQQDSTRLLLTILILVNSSKRIILTHCTQFVSNEKQTRSKINVYYRAT